MKEWKLTALHSHGQSPFDEGFEKAKKVQSSTMDAGGSWAAAFNKLTNPSALPLHHGEK